MQEENYILLGNFNLKKYGYKDYTDKDLIITISKLREILYMNPNIEEVLKDINYIINYSDYIYKDKSEIYIIKNYDDKRYIVINLDIIEVEYNSYKHSINNIYYIYSSDLINYKKMLNIYKKNDKLKLIIV